MTTYLHGFFLVLNRTMHPGVARAIERRQEAVGYHVGGGELRGDQISERRTPFDRLDSCGKI